MGHRVVVAHPLKTRMIADAKIKTDKLDAKTLAELLRGDLLPTS
jgi:transposase